MSNPPRPTRSTRARTSTQRQETLAAEGGASQQDVDDAKAALDMADAKVEVNQKALDLAVIGPRAEDIDAGRGAAACRRSAAGAVCVSSWRTPSLSAPLDGIVRSRLIEPGEMASPQKPVFSLAIIDPKWVRAYVSETDLGTVCIRA